MPHPTLARYAWRAALTLALAASLSAACGDPKPPPTPDPPQVALTVPKPTVAGTSLKVIVNVTGCDTVSTLNLYDRETLLKAFTYGGEDTTLELLSADIPYATLGLAAYLSLNAEAVCQDGRRNKSQPQPATFLPVSRVVEAPANGRPVVTDFFVVDDSSTNATFIGCGVPSTGLPTLYKVDATGRVTAERQMPFACTAETVMTERNAVSGKRWLWTPGVGACAVDANLNITGRTAEDLRPTMLSVLPDGDAIVVNRIDEVRRLSHMPDATTPTIATVKWIYRSLSLEGVLAPPLIRSDGIIKLVTLGPGPTAVLANVVVDDLNANGIPDEQNRIYSQRQYTLRTVSRNEPLPLAAFNADGTRLYLGIPLANNQSHVMTCVANPAGAQQTCEGPNNLWTSAALPVPLARVYFHPESSRVLAIGRQRVWFLDAASGAIRTWESRSLDANGALNVLQVLPGRGSELFLLNAPPRGSLEPPTVPHEIVAVDQSPSGEARELFRHQVSSSLSGAVDAEGRLWLRVGPDLAQALPMGEYRRYRP